MPLRRLVITGKDTADNLALCFGQHNVSGLVAWLQRQLRREILLRPDPRSFMSTTVRAMNLDENCPRWTPRRMNDREHAEILEIKVIQAMMRSFVAAGGVGSITVQEIYDRFAGMHGERWFGMRQSFDTALEALEPGLFLRIDK